MTKSKIHGRGLFSKAPIKKNTYILTALVDDGRYVSPTCSSINHSNKPNTYLVKDCSIYNLYSLKDIAIGEEIVANYYNTPKYIKKPKPNWE